MRLPWPSTRCGRGPSREMARSDVASTAAADVHQSQGRARNVAPRSEEHTSELQSRSDLVCRLLLEKKKECIPDLAFLHERRRGIAVGCRCGAASVGTLFLFPETAPPHVYTLSLHDALPIS